MASFSLSPDDSPPKQLGIDDRVLRRRLDESLGQRFVQRCDPASLKLLSVCDWTITTAANVVTLAVICPNRQINWQLLNRVVPLGNILVEFSQDAKLRIYATPDMLDMFEIRVDEISIYPK